VKCRGREEFVVLGWTPPSGSRVGFGALHVGYYDSDGRLHYAGGVGTGFNTRELTSLKRRLDDLATERPPEMLVSGDPLDRSIHWIRPDLVIEVQYVDWSGSGRVRHASYLGLREDKKPTEVVREIADAEAERVVKFPESPDASPRRRPIKFAIPPRQELSSVQPKPGARIVVAKAPQRKAQTVGGIGITHPDRELWPGITKRDLAEYWVAVADHALPEFVHRPLAIVRCPDGINGEKFFQKNSHGIMPREIRDGSASGSPYFAIDDLSGLVALAQMSAIEIHPWGATEADPLHPDRLIFDLDPGEGVPFTQVIKAAHEVREKLQRLGLESFCRTTGGKGLHVVISLVPRADWEEAKAWCRAFAELMSLEQPDKYVPMLSKVERRGRILIDWLRNAIGNTAIGSYCPRARPGAGIATPLAWSEVTPKLDPSSFTLKTVPARLQKLRRPPWSDFDKSAHPLPQPARKPVAPAQQPASPPAGRSRIVVARAPKHSASR
jgi:bifunctional non-homologous end joining protein LigD